MKTVLTFILLLFFYFQSYAQHSNNFQYLVFLVNRAAETFDDGEMKMFVAEHDMGYYMGHVTYDELMKYSSNDSLYIIGFGFVESSFALGDLFVLRLREYVSVKENSKDVDLEAFKELPIGRAEFREFRYVYDLESAMRLTVNVQASNEKNYWQQYVEEIKAKKE
ncbi:MAG: hypothetical protein N2510_08330 [Ignavibacteria bacterium]|nr:hypothetical protein [Ignavibacteria bacterium]